MTEQDGDQSTFWSAARFVARASTWSHCDSQGRRGQRFGAASVRLGSQWFVAWHPRGERAVLRRELKDRMDDQLETTASATFLDD